MIDQLNCADRKECIARCFTTTLLHVCARACYWAPPVAHRGAAMLAAAGGGGGGGVSSLHS